MGIVALIYTLNLQRRTLQDQIKNTEREEERHRRSIMPVFTLTYSPNNLNPANQYDVHIKLTNADAHTAKWEFKSTEGIEWSYNLDMEFDLKEGMSKKLTFTLLKDAFYFPKEPVGNIEFSDVQYRFYTQDFYLLGTELKLYPPEIDYRYLLRKQSFWDRFKNVFP